MMHWMRDSEKNRRVILAIIITFKILLMGFFSSDYQDKMFIPFVGCFLSGENPYTFYFENELMSSFPYMPFMLLVESIGGFLLMIFTPEFVFFKNIIFKIPLMLFDYIGYFFLRKMGVRFKYAIIFYSCSPIILYATYMHGQLDIIPTVLLVISVYYLVSWRKKHNVLFCVLFLGMAIGAKTHILAAIPIIYLYVASKKGHMRAVKTMLQTLIVAMIIATPFMGKGLINTVLLNDEQSVLFAVSIDYGSTQILLPIIVLAVIYLRAFELNYFNRELLFSMLALLFAVFLVCVPPNAGWFIWIVPFVTILLGYNMMQKYKTMLIYGVFNLLYMVYFIFAYKSDFVDLYFLDHAVQFMGRDNYGFRFFVFTLMIACLGIVIYQIYAYGMASSELYKRGAIPFTIGIAGDSGVGKSKMLEKIERLFGSDKDLLFIEGDGDHRWERNNENWEKYTALHPLANYLYKQANDIKSLRYGNHVQRVEYDHGDGVFTKKHRVKPKKYIVLCGLHSLYLPLLRDELDLKIFMDTEDELRKLWKIERDVQNRGYSKEEIVAQINKRIPDAQRYIYPQKKYADIVITYFDKTLNSCMEEEHTVELSLKLEVNIDVNLEKAISCFEAYDINPRYRISEDLLRQEIEFDGEEIKRNKIDFEAIAERTIPQYQDLFTYRPKWGSDVEGIIQLVILILISNKMNGRGGIF